jgi:hypothetical protein
LIDKKKTATGQPQSIDGSQWCAADRRQPRASVFEVLMNYWLPTVTLMFLIVHPVWPG